MSNKKRQNQTENYTFFFKDGYYVTFPLTKVDFAQVKNAVLQKIECILTENYAINLSDLRYVAKQEEKKEEEAPQSAVPEYLEQDVYEYLRGLERGKEETGY
jgi:hypothetical protein